ncbi:MAG: hypothetical protein PGN21_10180 [Sphingomonas paucimobilis]
MAERKLVAMRRVAAVRTAQRAVAERALGVATGAVVESRDALARAGEQVDLAFATWRALVDAVCFQPEIQRYHAAQLIARTGEADAARADCDRAGETLTAARQALHCADAALERSGMIVRRLARRERMQREERQLADHADRVTQRWGRR